jgi:hypothetical protein
MPALKGKEEEVSRLSYVPVVSVALKDAEIAAYNAIADAFRNIFAQKVRNSEIGRLVSNPENFDGAGIRYAKMADQDIYSVEVTFNKQRMLLTLRVDESSTEMLLTDRNGNEVEFLRHTGREIEVRRG